MVLMVGLLLKKAGQTGQEKGKSPKGLQKHDSWDVMTRTGHGHDKIFNTCTAVHIRPTGSVNDF
jgi:hypothetical protein